MLSRFFGKRDQPDESPTQEAGHSRINPAYIAEHDTAWDFRDDALEMLLRESPSPKVANPVGSPIVRPPVAPVTRVARGPEPVVVPQMVPTPPPVAEVDLPIPASSFSAPDERTPEERRSDALAVVEVHHKRIGNTIRTLWGYKECSVYINKLIMAGGDGMGQARVGFNQDAVQAMLELAALHDGEFGAPDSAMGGLQPML